MLCKLDSSFNVERYFSYQVLVDRALSGAVCAPLSARASKPVPDISGVLDVTPVGEEKQAKTGGLGIAPI